MVLKELNCSGIRANWNNLLKKAGWGGVRNCERVSQFLAEQGVFSP